MVLKRCFSCVYKVITQCFKWCLWGVCVFKWGFNRVSSAVLKVKTGNSQITQYQKSPPPKKILTFDSNWQLLGPLVVSLWDGVNWERGVSNCGSLWRVCGLIRLMWGQKGSVRGVVIIPPLQRVLLIALLLQWTDSSPSLCGVLTERKAFILLRVLLVGFPFHSSCPPAALGATKV